jgi:cell division protein FtsL
MNTLRGSWVLVLVLGCAVLASAVGSIWSRHRARELFVELERLNREQEKIDIAWGNLQIEQASFSTHAHVESLAVSKLQMRAPDPDQIRVVMP